MNNQINNNYKEVKKCNCSKGAKDVIEWCKSRALTY